MKLKEPRQQRGMVRAELAKEIGTTVPVSVVGKMVEPICF